MYLKDMKNEKIQIRMSKDDKEILAKIAEKLDVPASQIVREAIRDKYPNFFKTSEEKELELAA